MSNLDEIQNDLEAIAQDIIELAADLEGDDNTATVDSSTADTQTDAPSAPTTTDVPSAN